MTKTNNNEMLNKFDEFLESVAEAHKTIRMLLAQGNYAAATRAMTTLNTRQAQVAVSMRSAMMRAGLIKEGEL